MLYNKNIKTDDTNDSSAVIFNFIGEKSEVLDMGCACGDLAEQLHIRKKCTVYGLEFNPSSVAKCIQKKVFAQVRQFDLNTLAESSFPEFKQKFDYCILGDVLEHLQNPDDVLKTAASYLKKDGVVIISLPNLSHASIKANLLLNDFTRTPLGILDKTHLHFFTYKNIAELLYKCSLDIKDMAYTSLPADGYQPHKISELPAAVADFILEDPHSSVFQYILVCQHAGETSFRNLLARLKRLDAAPAKSAFLFRIKRFIMTKCPFLIKYIERLRG